MSNQSPALAWLAACGLLLSTLSARAAEPGTDVPHTISPQAATQNVPSAEVMPRSPDEADTSTTLPTSSAVHRLEPIVVTGSRLDLREREGPLEIQVYAQDVIRQSGQARGVQNYLPTQTASGLAGRSP